MKLELKYKEVLSKLFPLLYGAVNGSIEVSPGIRLSVTSRLQFELLKEGESVVVNFPTSHIKIMASKWLFQVDGFVKRVVIKKDNMVVEIENLPDLTVYFV